MSLVPGMDDAAPAPAPGRADRSEFTWRGARRGAWLCLPLLMGTMPFGLVCGLVGQARGLSLLETVMMSALVYGGSSQIVALGSWTHPAPVLAASAAALAVNLRFALMGPVLGPWLDSLRGWRLWSSLFVLADQTWALSVREMQSGARDVAFLLGNGATMYVGWVLTTALGYVLADVIRPAPGHPLFFAALALFLAMLCAMWRGGRDLLPWAVAALVAVAVARLLPGRPWYIVAGALSGALAGGLRDAARRGAAQHGAGRRGAR